MLNVKTGEMAFTLLVKSFTFKRALMEEHFNENYLEIITNLKEKEWITTESLIVIEFKTFKEKQLKDCDFLQQLELRKYGGTSFLFANIIK